MKGGVYVTKGLYVTCFGICNMESQEEYLIKKIEYRKAERRAMYRAAFSKEELIERLVRLELELIEE